MKQTGMMVSNLNIAEVSISLLGVRSNSIGKEEILFEKEKRKNNHPF